MKHKYMKYVWNNVWSYPPEQGIWCREKDSRGRVLLSMCRLGGYVLEVQLFTTFSIPGDLNSPWFSAYDFSINTLKGERIFRHGLENNQYFDTNIDEAERTAEYVWKHTLFYDELKWAPVRTITGTRWKRIHWGIRG